jgi:Glycosyl transferase family 2
VNPVGFGSKASAFVQRLPRDAPVIASDYSGITEAIGFAFDARRRGERFATALLLDDERVLVARNLAGQIEQSYAHIDERRAGLTMLAAGTLAVNGNPVSNLRVYDPRVLNLGRIFVRLGESLLVRSWREHRALTPTLRYSPEWVVRFAPPDQRVPDLAAVDTIAPRALVVWAPDATASDLTLWRLALAELHTPIIFACAEERETSGTYAFYGPSRHVDALRSASAILDASLDDPGAARVLSRLGRGVAVTATSGAEEYLQGALIYDPADRASIIRAAMTVIGRPPPSDEGAASAVEQWLPPPPPPSDAKVTVIIPTYERPQQLRRVVRSLERQTHRNLDIVIVNDGGADLSGLGWPPQVRLIQLPENNGGPWPAINAALPSVAGDYVTFLADDDALFPDHFARLVYALETTGGKAAHSDLVSVYMERDGDGPYSVVGYDIDFDSVAEISRMLFIDLVGAPTHMLRRSLVDEMGSGDLSLPIALDYELWLRYATRYDWVHVEAVTAIYSRRNDKGRVTEREMVTVSQFERYLPAMQMIYERHPAPGRPAIEAERQNVLNSYRAMGKGPPTEPPMRLAPRPYTAE